MKISHIFFSLMSGLSVALLVLMPAIPQAKIGRSFFVSNVLLCLLLFVPFLPSLISHEPTAFFAFGVPHVFLLFAVALLLLLGGFFLKRGQKVNPLIYAGAIAFGVGALFIEVLGYLPPQNSFWWAKIFIFLNFFSSAFLLGATLFAMLLGHWYLVQFDLDKALLRRVCWLYSIALGLRVVLLAVSFMLYSKIPALSSGAMPSLLALNGHGLFFWMRLVVGILLPLILAYMIYETARIGANQSCTGLLYIAVVFVFMGEMVAHYVYFLKGIPI